MTPLREIRLQMQVSSNHDRFWIVLFLLTFVCKWISADDEVIQSKHETLSADEEKKLMSSSSRELILV